MDEKIIELLWAYLKRDPEHKDRRQTGWGTKTKQGLVACIRRIASEEAGSTSPAVNDEEASNVR